MGLQGHGRKQGKGELDVQEEGWKAESIPSSLGGSSSIGLSRVPSPADGLCSFSLPGHIQPVPPALPGEPVHPLGLIARARGAARAQQ